MPLTYTYLYKGLYLSISHLRGLFDYLEYNLYHTIMMFAVIFIRLYVSSFFYKRSSIIVLYDCLTATVLNTGKLYMYGRKKGGYRYKYP